MNKDDNNIFHFDIAKHKWRRRIKYAIQRIKYGYCDYDLYDFDHYLSHLLNVSLNKLADTTHGYPYGREYEEWVKELKDVAEAAYYMFHDKEDKRTVDDILEDYILAEKMENNQEEVDKLKEELHIKTQEINEQKTVLTEVVFDWLKTNYFDLWD